MHTHPPTHTHARTHARALFMYDTSKRVCLFSRMFTQRCSEQYL